MNSSTPDPKRFRNSISRAAEARFRERLAELGGQLLEPDGWRGSDAWHVMRCAAGHEFDRRPRDVMRTGRLCRTCPA